MDPLNIAAASGLRARMESLDMLANNLANAGTQGFKADREYYTLYVAPEADGSVTAPLIDRAWTDYRQGTLQPTGSPLDLAFEGDGFLAVNGPSGPLYTRNGALRLSAKGAVTTQDGYEVRDVRGRNIVLDPARTLVVDRDGSFKQDGQTVAQLQLVTFKNPSALRKEGNSYFRIADQAVTPAPAASLVVHQGSLENSNVGSAESAVRLVSVMRQFEMLQRAVSLGAEMNRKAVEEVAKVNS